jgi:hypothetical protein
MGVVVLSNCTTASAAMCHSVRSGPRISTRPRLSRTLRVSERRTRRKVLARSTIRDTGAPSALGSARTGGGRHSSIEIPTCALDFSPRRRIPNGRRLTTSEIPWRSRST